MDSIIDNPPLSFIEYLEKRLKEDGPKQKGERTRERLKIATAKILEEVGYHALRISDVTERAGVAEGTFYIYFKDKKDVSLAVLTSLMEDFLDMLAQQGSAMSQFEAIQVTNRFWIAICRANPGLIRCVFQLGDEDPEFAQVLQRNNRRWHDVVARRMRRSGKEIGREQSLFLIYLLGAMMDDIVHRLVVYPDPYFHEILDALGASDEDVADAATLIWMRVLNPNAGVPEGLSKVAKGLAEWMNL